MTQLEWGERSLLVGDLVEDAAQLDEAGFAQAHGQHFFLCRKSELSRPMARMTMRTLTDMGPSNEINTSVSGYVALPIRHRNKDPLKTLLSVGRAESCDVMVPHPSISSVHALIELTEDGLIILDVGSKNGTSYNGAPVPVRGRGQGIKIEPMGRLKLGSVESTLLNAKRLQLFAQSFAGAAD